MTKYQVPVAVRLGTSEGIKHYFKQQQWPIAQEDLSSTDFIRQTAHAWSATLKYGFNPLARSYPAPQDLFALAVDACYGPHLFRRSLRFKVARLMARKRHGDLGSFIKQRKGKNFDSEVTSTQTVKNIESSERSITWQRASELATSLAVAYQVNSGWLTGEPDDLKSYDAVLPLVVMSELRKPEGLIPPWLLPWIRAVETAVSTCEVLDNEVLLSDERFAGELLELFLRKRHTAIATNPATWSSLVYFPLAHAAMVETRRMVLDGIPAWMMPDGDASSLRMTLGQRACRNGLRRMESQNR